MKKYSPIIVFILSIFLFCGCYDSKEINETAYIIALGIDKAEEKGFSYTFQFSAPLATTNKDETLGDTEGKETQNPTVQNLTISAPDFYTAKNMTNNFLSKRVDMSHLKLIVFSADLEKERFLDHSQFMLHEREVRPHTLVAVSKGLAENYLKSVSPSLEANTAKYYELLSLRSNNVYSITKRLSDFVDEINSDFGVSVLPIAFSGSNPSLDNFQNNDSLFVGIENSKVRSRGARLSGMAIFKDGKVEALAGGKDAMIFNILKRSIKSCTITLKNPHAEESFLTFRLNIPQPSHYTVKSKEKPCTVLVSQSFEIKFFGAFLPEGFSSERELYSYAKKVLSDEFLNYFQRLSRTYRADIMKIGSHIKQSFLTDKEWQEFDWESAFKSADFEIEIGFI